MAIDNNNLPFVKTLTTAADGNSDEYQFDANATQAVVIVVPTTASATVQFSNDGTNWADWETGAVTSATSKALVALPVLMRVSQTGAGSVTTTVASR